MILSELKKRVDFWCDHGHSNDAVLITIFDRSVGAKASAGIVDINAGVDWEHGQIRIHTDKRLISYELNRDKAIAPIEIDYNYGIKKYHVIHCPKCENKLRKSDRYCSLCGQKIK